MKENSNNSKILIILKMKKNSNNSNNEGECISSENANTWSGAESEMACVQNSWTTSDWRDTVIKMWGGKVPGKPFKGLNWVLGEGLKS